MAFQQDTEETPVIFRYDHGEVTAVFPTIPGAVNGSTMACYAHVGQHSGCSYDWYRTTRPATPEEYASLQRELESAPYGYRLKLCRRITPAHRRLKLCRRLTPAHRRAFLAELRR